MDVTSEKTIIANLPIVSIICNSHTSNLSMVVDVIENTDDIDETFYFDLFKRRNRKIIGTIEYLNEIITFQQKTNVEN
jgi:hypothetical protein